MYVRVCSLGGTLCTNSPAGCASGLVPVVPQAIVCKGSDVIVWMLALGCLLLQVEEIAKIASTNKLFGGNCTIPRVLQEMMSELALAAQGLPSMPV